MSEVCVSRSAIAEGRLVSACGVRKVSNPKCQTVSLFCPSSAMYTRKSVSFLLFHQQTAYMLLQANYNAHVERTTFTLHPKPFFRVNVATHVCYTSMCKVFILDPFCNEACFVRLKKENEMSCVTTAMSPASLASRSCVMTHFTCVFHFRVEHGKFGLLCFSLSAYYDKYHQSFLSF